MRRIFIDVGGLTCPKKGASDVQEALIRWIEKVGLQREVEVVPRGCFGLCNLAPNLYIEPDGIWYSRFTTRDVPIIVKSHLLKGKPVTRLIHYPDPKKVAGTVLKMVPGSKKQGEKKMPETLVGREIEVGEVAPDFTLKDENGQEVTLSSFRGKKNLVLAFYPFDWSPVCTTENCAMSEDFSQFQGKDTVVLGISADSHFSHKAWKEKLGLKHSLLSDLKREVCKKYGLYFEDLNCTKRATVVVEKQGKVIFKKVQEIKTPRSNQEILTAIR